MTLGHANVPRRGPAWRALREGLLPETAEPAEFGTARTWSWQPDPKAAAPESLKGLLPWAAGGENTLSQDSICPRLLGSVHLPSGISVCLPHQPPPQPGQARSACALGLPDVLCSCSHLVPDTVLGAWYV